MLLRIAERTAVLLVSLGVSSALVFGFMVLLPGDPARVALGVNATEADVSRLRLEFGLERPLLEQYLTWLGGLMRFDPGLSYVSRAQIGPQLADRLQVSLILVAASMVIAVALALPFGTLMAVHHRRASGLVLSAVSQVGVAVPPLLALARFVPVPRDVGGDQVRAGALHLDQPVLPEIARCPEVVEFAADQKLAFPADDETVFIEGNLLCV